MPSSPEAEFLTRVFELLGSLNTSLSLLAEIYAEKFPDLAAGRPSLALVKGGTDG